LSGLSRMAAICGLHFLVLSTGGCAEKTFDPPDREARVAEAQSRFEEARFDTLTWSSPEARATEGNGVFAARCGKCHGVLGRGTSEGGGSGGTTYADSRGLEVPSVVGAGWRYATQPDSVRRVVYVGHVAGMPTWGVAGITEREIDAVAYYLMEQLRPDVLGASGR